MFYLLPGCSLATSYVVLSAKRAVFACATGIDMNSNNLTEYAELTVYEINTRIGHS